MVSRKVAPVMEILEQLDSDNYFDDAMCYLEALYEGKLKIDEYNMSFLSRVLKHISEKLDECCEMIR